MFLEKHCPQHGDFSVVIWRGEPGYNDWGRGEVTGGPEIRLTEHNNGCPYDCGLCPEHEARTCTVLLEVTDRCNLCCPICFASSGGRHSLDPDLASIRYSLENILDTCGPVPLQLSGGEPTLRDDLPEIASLAKTLGFPHVQVNTNGIRIANNPDYLQRMVQGGVDLIYLQFDGVTDEVHRQLRGRALARIKDQVIEHCTRAKVGVQLVPTIVPGINDQEIGAIIHFAKAHIPVVKGVHFQPISYFGRFHYAPDDRTRITIPEVLRAMESQTGGEVRADAFLPRRRHDSHCGFSGFFILDQDDCLKSTTHFNPSESSRANCRDVAGSHNVQSSPSEHVRKFITEKSRYIETDQKLCDCQRKSRLETLLSRAQTHYLSISGMPFQDVWNIDLERLRGCCVHVASRDGKLVPFCAYYLTSADGHRLIDYARGNHWRSTMDESCLGGSHITDEAIEVYQQRLGINLRINNVFNELASTKAILKFVDGIGDPNPLWRDPDYARCTRYKSLVAPPSWVASVFPTWVLQGLPGVHAFQTSTDWRFHKPVFEDDRIKPNSTFTKFRFLDGGFAGRSILETQEARYFNQRDELVAQAEVTGLRAERDSVRERDKYGDLTLPHPWTEEELLAIQEQILSEKVRGPEMRYWEDIALGEELPAIIKGPLGLSDIIAYCIGAAPVRILAHEVALHEYQKHPAWAFRDPDSKSLEPIYSVHYNAHAAQGAGLPLPYDIGTQRHCWLMQMLTNWMGDDGWLKRCYAKYTGFVFLSDAIWIRGEVMKKYVDENGEHCVDIATFAKNQRGEEVMPGESTIILPSRRSGTRPLDTRLQSGCFQPET